MAQATIHAIEVIESLKRLSRQFGGICCRYLMTSLTASPESTDDCTLLKLSVANCVVIEELRLLPLIVSSSALLLLPNNRPKSNTGVAKVKRAKPGRNNVRNTSLKS